MPDGYLRPGGATWVDGWLYAGPGGAEGYLRREFIPSYVLSVSISFPTQYSGLRYFHGTVKELCLVALADAPAGNQIRIRKNGVTYALYLVDTSDPNASPVRVRVGAGTKAVRYKT